MASVCAGLVTVDEESKIIRLVHYTTQEYFERTWESWFPNTHTDITKICVTYLSFNAFGTGFCLTDKEFEARLQSNALYDYAAQNWGNYAHWDLGEVEELIVDFLKSEAKVAASSQAMIVSLYYHFKGYSQGAPRQIKGVHLAAYFGLRDTMTALLKNKYEPDSKDSDGQTPLSWAAGKGHEAVVKLLWRRRKSTWTPRTPSIDGRRYHGQQRWGTRRWSSCCWRRKSTWTPRTPMDGRRCHGRQGTGTRRWSSYYNLVA